MSEFTSPYRKNVLDDRILNLTTMNPQNKRATWQVRFSGSKVRLSIWHNVEGVNGKLGLDMEIPMFLVFIELINKVINDPREDGVKEQMPVFGYGKGGYKEGVKPRGDLFVGRSKGTIWVAFISGDKPKLKFQLQNSQFFKLQHDDGSFFSPKEISDIVATAYVKSAYRIITTLACTEFVDPDDRPGGNKSKSNNNSSNNYNRNNTNNAQAQASASSDFGLDDGGEFVDDIF